MLATSLFAIAAAVLAIVASVWGMDERRARLRAERQLARSRFALGRVAAERAHFHGLFMQAVTQLRALHATAMGRLPYRNRPN